MRRQVLFCFSIFSAQIALLVSAIVGATTFEMGRYHARLNWYLDQSKTMMRDIIELARPALVASEGGDFKKPDATHPNPNWLEAKLDQESSYALGWASPRADRDAAARIQAMLPRWLLLADSVESCCSYMRNLTSANVAASIRLDVGAFDRLREFLIARAQFLEAFRSYSSFLLDLGFRPSPPFLASDAAGLQGFADYITANPREFGPTEDEARKFALRIRKGESPGYISWHPPDDTRPVPVAFLAGLDLRAARLNSTVTTLRQVLNDLQSEWKRRSSLNIYLTCRSSEVSSCAFRDIEPLLNDCQRLIGRCHVSFAPKLGQSTAIYWRYGPDHPGLNEASDDTKPWKYFSYIAREACGDKP